MIPRFYELGEDQFEDLCREIFQEEPDVETVERYGMLADTSGATNILESWLNNSPDRLALLQPELRALLMPDAIARMMRDACSGISAKTDERVNWFKLLAICGDFPLSVSAKDALEGVLLEMNVVDYLDQDPWIAIAALRVVGQHAKQWSPAVRARVEIQLFDLATSVGKVTLDADVRAALSTSILDTLVSCAWWHAEGEARATALASVLERLAETGPPVFEGAGLLVLRLCQALPVRQARHLWRTRDLLRRSVRL
jgi:hypothetical protein